MNEITRIHLGRQPLTISVDAHHELKAYLAAIEKQAGADVRDEVELRMAELLAERGIKGDKTVLTKDVDYLKKQLGEPKDFHEDDDSKADETEAEATATKRLFRDEKQGMLAGVSAGLGNYFGIDPLLFRLIFVIGTITGGWGILAYILLWLLVPEAKSSSERLQMQGKPVTIESLKQTVDRADIKGTAQRAGRTAADGINLVLDLMLKAIGAALTLAGITALSGLIVIKVYMLLHQGALFEEGLFPVTSGEHWLVYIGFGLAAILALFTAFTGIAMFRRKWPVPVWVSAVLAGLFFVGAPVAAALAGDAAPQVRDRYEAQQHTITQAVPDYSSVEFKGRVLDYDYEYSAAPSVKFTYFGDLNAGDIKTTVQDGKLTIDASALQPKKCSMLCLYRDNNLKVTLYGPQRTEITGPYGYRSKPDPADYESAPPTPAPTAAPAKAY